MTDGGRRYDLRMGPVDDWTALHALLVTCFEGMEGRIDPPSSLKAMTPETLRAKAEDETLVTVWQDERLVGCGYFSDTGRSIYLGKLAVLPAHRGRGLLRRMVAEAAEMARRLDRPVLDLSTRVELVENHATFAALGFVETARTAHPGFDRPTSIRMELRIPSA